MRSSCEEIYLKIESKDTKHKQMIINIKTTQSQYTGRWQYILEDPKGRYLGSNEFEYTSEEEAREAGESHKAYLFEKEEE